MAILRSEAEQAVLERLAKNHDEIVRAMLAAKEGNPFAAETDPARRQRRLQAKAGLTPNEAAGVDNAIQVTAAQQGVAAGQHVDIAAAIRTVKGLAPELEARKEVVWGDSADFVNVSFLTIGATAARAVGRVAYRNGRAQGSGFLIGDGLFLTNHHVIGEADAAKQFVLEFDYERDLAGNIRTASRFAIDATLFLTDGDGRDGLDYSIFAVGKRLSGPHTIADFGFTGISDAGDKHMLGEYVNIVQHPSGRFKEVVLRENRLVGRYDNALHYVADTEPGSSGSPVFNSEWQVVALHHWGSPWREAFGPDSAPLPVDVNEGIRISSIVKQLRERLPTMDAAARKRVEKVLALGAESAAFTEASASEDTGSPALPAPRMEPDGRITLTIPVEISIRVPGVGAPAPAPAPDPPPPPPPPAGPALDRMRGRVGYKPGFIEGFQVPLPKLTAAMEADAARNSLAEAGDYPFELKYHHFSVVMNARRRMAYFTACNIDGATAKSADHSTGKVTPLTEDSPGLESAEADDWQDDPRIGADQQTGEKIYSGQKVPGFPTGGGRTARMFQKGHLVRRLDPAWGDDATALAAEEDTFTYTNAALQVGFFNMGSASADLPNSGGGKLWRTVENYVLRNAVATDARISSFTGCIFEPGDRQFRGVGVPGRFFKIAVWAEAGKLKSLAMIADQRPVIEVWPEALFAGESLAEAEKFGDADELGKVGDFLTTIVEVERLTGLDFGRTVRNGDINAGESIRRLERAEDIPLHR
ncbi:DNA/RNA non-specific endonuclease [Sandaracinobacteroides hominis]|uniref:DNA/RNA non-specific endonuclease n=1 Tax=Sandaracinobacteroides hominis TaxID=2780086 RepID=UPI0018F4B82A|nr:DNA/RNA non-specific endonuclease [Sandaracinobacteroides hominis]